MTPARKRRSIISPYYAGAAAYAPALAYPNLAYPAYTTYPYLW